MAESVADVLRIMRLAIGRRNENDPDSSDATLLNYVNDFIQYSMPDDIHLFEQWGTLQFDITDGNDVYDFPSSDTATNFVNISMEAIISLKEPEDESRNWNKLRVYLDPGPFFQYWGVNNKDVLQEGWPTEMLYYDNQFTFRTVPDTTYTVYIYGYKLSPALTDNSNLPWDWWVRYLAYGAALDYAQDYNMSPESLMRISRGFNRERSLRAARTHNQLKGQRCEPRF